MARQLSLIATPSAEWRLDERTREIAREGIASARAALAAAAREARGATADRTAA